MITAKIIKIIVFITVPSLWLFVCAKVPVFLWFCAGATCGAIGYFAANSAVLLYYRWYDARFRKASPNLVPNSDTVRGWHPGE